MSALTSSTFCIITIASSATAAPFNYDEAFLGDISNDYLNPTSLVVDAGNNILTGALSGGTNDLDMFRLIVPQGLEVTAIRILEFAGGRSGSYLLMQPGNTLSSAPSNDPSTAPGPIGFSILSSGAIGSDVLPVITFASAPSIAPFFGAATLTEGSYAGWLNETGPASTYKLQFEVANTIPEPSTSLLAGLAAIALCGLRRR